MIAVGVRGCKEEAGVDQQQEAEGLLQLQGEHGMTRRATAAHETLSWPGAGLLAGPEGRH